MEAEQIERCLQGLRESFRADGADLTVEGVEERRVQLRLVLGPEACAECLLPHADMAQLLAFTVTRHFPEVEGVDLVDPRV